MESKIIIFESGKDIGIMSTAPKFYEENTPQKADYHYSQQ